jgi:hypothetical protein
MTRSRTPLFMWLLAFAMGISSIVLVEPAPVDALMLVLLALGTALGVVRLQAVPVLPGILLAGLALANIVSIPNAPETTRAVFYCFVTLYLITSWVVFVGSIDFYKEPLVKMLFRGYSIAGLIAAGLALASYFHIIGFQSMLLLYGRPKGPFKDPNVYGPFLVPLGVMAIMGCLPGAGKTMRIAVALLASLGIALSYSRACWINYALSLALFVILDLVLPSKSGKRSVSLGPLIGFAGVAVLAIVAVLQVPSVKAMLAVRLGQGGLQGYDQIRFQTQRMALQAAIDNPLGIGPGQAEGVFNYATHSSYMRVLSENGIFGLFCFVGFLLASTLQAVRNACIAPSYQGRALFLAACACICGHLVNSAVVDTVHWRHLWFLLALPWISPWALSLQPIVDGPSGSH